MNDNESKVLEAGARLFNALPGYILESQGKKDINHLIIGLIDALDHVEYTRSGGPLFDIIKGELPFRRKRAILKIEEKYGLTERESLILRYLANERNPTYIASVLGISKSTAKVHKYSIYKKLGVHSVDELREYLAKYETIKE